MHRTGVFAAVLALSGCAGAPGPATEPDFAPVAFAASPRARLYADCIAQAASAGRYGHAFDQVHVVVFTCEGDAARAFFDALGPWSARLGSEVVLGDRTVRSTTRIERDLFAADWCDRRADAYRCAVSLRTGEFAAP